MSNVIYPYRPANTDTRSIGGILSDFDALNSVVNGNLDNGNLAAAAAIVDSKLASPGNAIRRLIGQACGSSHLVLSAGQSLRMIPARDGRLYKGSGGADDLSTVGGPVLWHVVNADYDVAGRSTRYRMVSRADISFSNVAGAGSAVSRLSLATVSGTAGQIWFDAGTPIDIEPNNNVLSDGFYVPEVTVSCSSGNISYDILSVWQLFVLNI